MEEGKVEDRKTRDKDKEKLDKKWGETRKELKRGRKRIRKDKTIRRDKGIKIRKE